MLETGRRRISERSHYAGARLRLLLFLKGHPRTMEQLYFNTKEAARRFGIPVRTLILWREKRRGPVFYRVGSRVFYKAEDMENYIAAGMVRPKNKVES